MKKTTPNALIEAQKLAVKLTLALAKRNEEVMWETVTEERTLETRLHYCSCICAGGKYWKTLYRLISELQVVAGRKKKSDVNGDAQKLIAFFIYLYDWDRILPDIKKDIRKILRSRDPDMDIMPMSKVGEHDLVRLDTLNLSPRTIKGLISRNICTIGKFRKMTRRELELAAGLGCGVTSLNEARMELEKLGVNLNHWL